MSHYSYYIISLQPPSPCSGDLSINSIAILWHLQKVLGWELWQLPLLRPLPDRIKVLALVLRVEVDKSHDAVWQRHRFRTAVMLPFYAPAVVRIPAVRLRDPHLAENARVDRAHELLPQDVEAVRHVDFDNGFGVAERAFA